MARNHANPPMRWPERVRVVARRGGLPAGAGSVGEVGGVVTVIVSRVSPLIFWGWFLWAWPRGGEWGVTGMVRVCNLLLGGWSVARHGASRWGRWVARLPTRATLRGSDGLTGEEPWKGHWKRDGRLPLSKWIPAKQAKHSPADLRRSHSDRSARLFLGYEYCDCHRLAAVARDSASAGRVGCVSCCDP